MRKLEIGPGPSKIGQDWTTVGDFAREGVVDHVCMWGHEPLPLKDNSFDLVYASHSLEHVPWYLVNDALSECFRVLAPGGKIEIHVPDFEYIVKCYLEKKVGDPWIKFNNREHPLMWAASRVFSYGPTFSNYHKAAFDQDYLFHALTKAGFTNPTRLTEGVPFQYHGPINIGVSAEKPSK